MANAPDFIIELLKINCGAVQCSGYATEIEALFYIVFFPTVFLILFIYILTNFIFRGGGFSRGLRLLIAVAAYAFVVFQGMYNIFVSLSSAWWILTILLVGLFAFIRHLIKGGDGGGQGHMPGIGGKRSGLNILDRARGKARDAVLQKTGLETREEEIKRRTEEEIKRVDEKVRKKGMRSLTYEEKVVYLTSKGITVKEGSDVNKLIKTLEESSG